VKTKATTNTVKAVAKLAGVSVRTLHHYDQIGLLKPSSHTAAGYRLYAERDLERLQQVLFLKELGFDLKQIKRILEEPDFDRKAALVKHRALLAERQERVRRLIRSVDRTLEGIKRGLPMNAKMFDGFDATALEEEARQRWGDTPAFQGSVERVKRQTPAQTAEMQRESQEIIDGLIQNMDRMDASHPEVQALIARHHGTINRWFFTCTNDVYRQIGDGYVGDPRFTAFWDKFKPGLAVFIRDAIRAYTAE
jgi:DNA-binding transcriptional MerR regulator